MTFLRILVSKSSRVIIFIVALSIANGILNTFLLVFINKVISGEETTIDPLLAFIGLIVLGLLTNKVFHTYMIKLTNQTLYEFETSILDKLKNATYESFQKLGLENVYTAINDARTLANVPEILVNALNSIVIIVCCFTYLFFMSFLGGTIIVLLMVFLFLFYMSRNNKVERRLNVLRDLFNDYYKHLNNFLYGYKEIKMSHPRNHRIVEEYLKKNRNDGKSISIETSIKYLNNELTGNYSWYIVLGIIMFVLPRYFGFESSELTAFIVTILYLMGPLAILITLIPTYTNVKIASERIGAFEAELDVLQEMVPGEEEICNEEFTSLKLENLTYRYKDKDSTDGFTLGPISLEIEKGELIFITGGNGSGKTTLVNLLTGLISPVEGKVFYNETRVTDELRVAYRNNVSVVFSEIFLFDDNYDGYDFNQPATNSRLHESLKKLKLTDVAKIDFERSLIDPRLSKGQRKRLALLFLLLEDKPIVILDECAADQDPQFKSYFYKEFLPELRKKGKTLIVITHDDLYFDLCDRIITLDYGRIREKKQLLKV